MSMVVDLAAVASKLHTSRGSLSNWTGFPLDKAHQHIPAAKVARAIGCPTAWLLDLVAGRDAALSTSEAAHFLSLDIQKLQKMAREGHRQHDPRYSPMVRVGRTLRWSRNRLLTLLPAISPPMSPLAGHPDSNVLGPNGWECES